MEIAFLILRLLMAVALYAFLGWALWLIWSGLRRQAEKASEAPLPTLTLTLLGDPPRMYHFTRAEVNIGRQPGSDLRLDDAAVSSRHARLIYRSGQWWVEDLHSRNGTYLNQERIAAALVLASGDELCCGSAVLNVEIAGWAAPEAGGEI